MHITIQLECSETHWVNHPTYKQAAKNGDCGLDIPMPNQIVVPPTELSFTVDLGIKTSPTNAYMLVPRSSLSKTPLRMSNSIGIIDKGYRGNLMAKVDNVSDAPFVMEMGSVTSKLLRLMESFLNGIWVLSKIRIGAPVGLVVVRI